ncbi:MAG: AAA family ATPase [Bacteroidota bacterium]|nr:AAA family ATPase [Bacteroidota bacterium]
MSKIRIKNFGPIKEGFSETLPDGSINEWIDIKKVTVFIGNQGSGKSTVAKLISTFMWIEKSLINGKISELNEEDFIEEYCNYFRLKNYFKPTSEIIYEGEYCNISYLNQQISHDLIERQEAYHMPKIMYVPAERSFLGSVEGADKVTGLPQPLVTFMVENDRSLIELNESISLPFGDYTIRFDSSKNLSFISGADYELELTAASSGLHSAVPLFVVSRNLSYILASGKSDSSISDLNSRQLQKRSNELRSARLSFIVSDNDIDKANIQRLEDIIESKYKNSLFVNIVEEPEQNLFPTSQRKMLNSLLEFNNLSTGNKLIMTTHSPYLINYLTLCVKAEMVKSNMNSDDSFNKIAEIVPLESTVKADDLVIYELNEMLGTIKKLEDYKGLPSDDNELNSELEDSNELFAQLQEIEKGWR